MRTAKVTTRTTCDTCRIQAAKLWVNPLFDNQGRILWGPGYQPTAMCAHCFARYFAVTEKGKASK